MNQWEKQEDKHDQQPYPKENRTGHVRTSPKITCYYCEREGHTARYSSSKVPKKKNQVERPRVASKPSER
ncbi:hypothetical protein NPIL_471261 [Nephila pilipes]|uniref:CCHC-type domain-containing protein n=1 Tax=Nephila pilipes TaxID=299642 RepID=A0A8X6NKZ9_NEPPI|nr:hypothetical protein NPIL_471261 [Nephila pilipes]